MKSIRDMKRAAVVGSAFAALAAGCKKSEATVSARPTATAPPPRATPSTDAPTPAAKASASAAAGAGPSMSPADRQRYEAELAKCKQPNLASCEAVCDEFDPAACTFGASLMLQKRVPDDPVARARLNQKGCDKGALKSCNQLGTAYVKGDGVAADTRKATDLYQRSCDGGDGGGCSHLATLYGYGDLVPQDIEKAKAYSQKACNLGEKDCEPPIGTGPDATWPVDAKLEDVVIKPQAWDRRVIQLRDVAAYRGSPTTGYIFEPGDNPLTDGVPTMMDEQASDDLRKAWLKMPSWRAGVPVKKVTVRVEATMVPGRARFWIVDDLQFVGTKE